MTIRQLHEWAKKKGLLDCEVKISNLSVDLLGQHYKYGLRDLREKDIQVEELSYDEKTEKIVYF